MTFSADLIRRVSAAAKKSLPRDLDIVTELRVLEEDGSESVSQIILARGHLRWVHGARRPPDIVVSLGASDASFIATDSSRMAGHEIADAGRVSVSDPKHLLGLAMQYAFTPIGEAYRRVREGELHE
jgi:hypothetical protein